MYRVLLVIFSAFAVMQLTLSESDFISNQNAVGAPYFGTKGGLLPENMFDAVLTRLPCTSALFLISNLNYLSGMISSTDFFASVIDQVKIDNLAASIAKKPKELEDPMQTLVMALNIYQDLTEQALEDAVLKLVEMNEFIESDVLNTNYVASKKDEIVGDKLIKCCAIVDKAEARLKEYNATIEKCKDIYRDSIVPQLVKINDGIDDLTLKYDEENPYVETAKTEIRELSILIVSEIQTFKEKTEQALIGLGECIANKGPECEKFMHGIYTEFQTLLG
ncbi:uncharacterized protein LOC116341462 [Contarinia nasturtii]|uniref:uncharacterized protein LOC116341462 n=1 Tax=Contarinia nasturtii TaxID=265458 RepID=UPI0012D43352|nr:uncharacterized protein LOC116341462 [Contarinia nasturtii]